MREESFTYNPWEYTPLNREGELAYLSVALTTACNFRCRFCSKAERAPLELDATLLDSAIEEALELGLRKVELTGGEPLLYPALLDLVERLRSAGVTPLIVTNGSLITAPIAERLARAGALVAVSLNSLEERRFDHLTGTRAQLPRVLEGIRLLREAGFSSSRVPLLSIQSVASRETLSELPRLRAWAESQDCMFIINRPIPVGAMETRSLIDGHSLKALLGPDAQVPFSLDSPCNRLRLGCYLGVDGGVQPCPCIELQAGNLRQQSLTHIWRESPLLALSRGINRSLTGACQSCDQRERCYGCRALAYAVSGDLQAPDPDCFRQTKGDPP